MRWTTNQVVARTLRFGTGSSEEHPGCEPEPLAEALLRFAMAWTEKYNQTARMRSGFATGTGPAMSELLSATVNTLTVLLSAVADLFRG
jgi:hypothetical protein